MQSAYRQVVDVLEDAGEPLSRAELVERTDRPPDDTTDAIQHLCGRQVVRQIPEQGAYRLTYWPDERDCALCGDPVSDDDAVEIRLDSPEQGTDESMHGSLHRQCAFRLVD